VGVVVVHEAHRRVDAEVVAQDLADAVAAVAAIARTSTA
jgi:hypothetical protein